MLVNSIMQASVFLVHMCNSNREKYQPSTTIWVSKGKNQYMASINKTIWDIFTVGSDNPSLFKNHYKLIKHYCLGYFSNWSRFNITK